MKKVVLISVIALSFLSLKINAQAPNWLWAKSIGSSGNDIGYAVAVDDSGNVFTAGSFEGTVDFDPGPGTFNLTSLGILDAYLMKLDSAGNFLWAISIGGTQSDVSHALVTDHAGNIYLTGRFGNTVDFDGGSGVATQTSQGYYDIFVTKYSGAGNFQWVKTMGGQNDDQCLSLNLDTAGNIYGAGYFEGTADFDPSTSNFFLTSNGSNDAFVFKLENSGGFIWAKSWGGNLTDAATCVVTDGSGNVYSTGHFNGNVDFDPGAGISTVFNLGGGNDIFISKLDGSGNYLWAKPLGGVQMDVGRSLFADAIGNIYSSGNFLGTGDFDPSNTIQNLFSNGNADIYFSKLTESGNYAWAKSVGASQVDNNYSMVADAAGNIYTSGFYRGTVDFNPGTGVSSLISGGNNDAYISKLDSSGNFIWAKSLGGTFSEIGYSIAMDKSNHILITGSFMSQTIYLNSDTLTNAVALGATADIYIAKLDSGFTTSGVESIANESNISVYPNPAKDFLILNLPAKVNGETKITLTDLAGRTAYKTTAGNFQQLQLNTTLLANGIYVLRIESSAFTAVKKISIEK